MTAYQPDSLTGKSSPALSVNLRLQLSEVLDCANHLRGVAVLVVIPRNNLNLIQTVADRGNHGLGSVEEGAVLHTDNIGRNDRILVVTEALGSSSLHSGVDAFLGYVVALDYGGEDGGGAGANRNTLSSADELTVQLGDNQADSLGSAGGVGNDVASACAGSSHIALSVRAVQNHLVAWEPGSWWCRMQRR